MRSLLLSIVLLLGLQASANNMFIPNQYRNRRTVNLFPAIGWSDRKEVSLSYANSTTTTKTDSGNQADSFDTNLSVQAGYRTSMLEAYLSYGQFANKTEYELSWANGNRDKNTIGAGLTYKF